MYLDRTLVVYINCGSPGGKATLPSAGASDMCWQDLKKSLSGALGGFRIVCSKARTPLGTTPGLGLLPNDRQWYGISGSSLVMTQDIEGWKPSNRHFPA